MKKYILFYILLVISVSILQGQNKSRFYGLNRSSFTAGNNIVTQQYGTLNNTVITANKYSGIQSFPLTFETSPYFRDTTLNNYEIGEIPEQSVATGSIVYFYIKCDSLPGSKTYSILPMDTFKGVITFNTHLQYFSFKPDTLDDLTYQIKFTAINATDTISQLVKFRTYQLTHPEIYAFGVGNSQPLPDPNAKEYQLLSVTNNHQKNWFNGQNRTTRSISISGVDLSVENVQGNLLYALSDNKDIGQLNIYADKLLIKDTFNLPQTEVNIYCRQLIFEDGTNTAAINTTPIAPDAAIPDSNGIDGATAGRINVFTGEIIDNRGGIRFRLLGGDGQSATNAIAGSGGNGGILFSNQDIASKGDYLGGLEVIHSGANGKPALKHKGDIGKFVKDSINLRWIHPNYIRQYISYSNDAYFTGHGKVVLPSLIFYTELISTLTNSTDTASIDAYTMSDLLQVQMELTTLIDRINSGYDFFGNPPGWVPLLSFEFTKAAFDTELHHAMQILYLDYFISTSADTLQKRINGFTALRDELRQRSNIDRNNFNNLVLVTVPEIENSIELNKQRMAQIELDIKRVSAEIQARAEKAANRQKKASWEKIAGGIGQVATMLPFPAVQAAGAGITAGLQFYDAVKDVDNLNLNSAESIISAAGKSINTYDNYHKEFTTTVGQWKQMRTQWQDFFPIFQGGMHIKAIQSQISKGGELKKNISNTFNNLKSEFKQHSELPDQDIEKIKSNLLSNDPAYAALNSELNDVKYKGKQLLEEYSNTNNQILTLGTQIMGYGLAFDDANNKVLSSSSQLDHRTVHYIHYLRENALQRLKKYYYYMAKAYEARTLLPFTGNLNLSPILTSIENMAISASKDNSVLTPAQYASFSGLYEQQVEAVAQEIYDYYIDNAPPQTITTIYSLTKNDITNLNHGESVIFNPTKRGLFGNNEENVRINNIKVLSLVDSIGTNTTIGNPARIDVRFEYPLISYVKRKGKVYYFNNYNRNTNTPLTWSSRFDITTNQITDFKPSSANASLLISLLTDKKLPNTNEDILMYSRPSASADLILSSTYLNNNGKGNLAIKGLKILIEYDFNTKPNNISYLDILTEPNWIVPNYNVNKSDQNGMKNGQGDMTRTYVTSSTNLVNLTVEKKIGGYRFERWLNQGGYPVMDKDSINPSRTFIMHTNQAMKVKFKWAGAKLSLPDTLYFDADNLTQNLIIRNVGEADSMYWVQNGISSFVSITPNITEGFGNETLSVSLSIPTNEKIGYISIMAPEAENAIDTVWLKYNNLITKSKQTNDFQRIALYPNPGKEKFYISIPDQLNMPYQVNVIDAYGKKINLKFEKQSNIIKFDSSDLPVGIYFVAVIFKDKQRVLKFIKTY